MFTQMISSFTLVLALALQSPGQGLATAPRLSIVASTARPRRHAMD
jgi:hypothetical protein